MRYVSWTWFWYVLVGFVLGGGLVFLWSYLREKAIKLVWYEILLIAVSAIVFIFMGQTFIASLGEGEPQAAWLSLFFMGFPIVLMGVAAFRSVSMRLAKSEQ
jgi:uncharacterized membrane protein